MHSICSDAVRQTQQFARWIGSRSLFVQALPSSCWRIINGGDDGVLMKFIRDLESKANKGIYWGINPMRKGTSSAPKNADIECRRLLLIDIDDPDHDRNIPASAAGKAASLATLNKVTAWLGNEHGWPGPVQIDSGNGHQAFYAIELVNDHNSARLVSAFLHALRDRFGPLIDTSVSDARRTARLPGTWNRRGPESTDRPHRLCKFITLPEGPPQIVSSRMIENVIGAIQQWKERWHGLPPAPLGDAGRLRPGDEFNRRASWSEILEPHGWTIDDRRGEQIYWTRPGKDDGVSASSGYCRTVARGDLLHVFSTNAAPLLANESYCKFSAFALLNHGGDYSAAASDLASRGYGQRVVENATIPATSCSPAQRYPAPIPLCIGPEVPEFPVDVFPSVIQRLTEEIAWAMNCPPDFAGVPILTLAGGAIGNSRHIAITSTHTQPPLLFSGTVSPPGTAKSPPLMLLLAPFEAVQAQLLQEHKARRREPDQDSVGSEPPLKRCIVSNITTETLGRLLTENPRGLLMSQDELISVVNGMNQYKNGKGNDRQFYLQVWSQATILVDRQTDRQRGGLPLYVRQPFLALHGNLQDDVLGQLRGEKAGRRPSPDDGWQDRFLLSYPKVPPDVGETWRSVSDQAKADWQQTIETLLRLEMIPRANGPGPAFVPLGSCAREIWERFTHHHAAERNALDFPRYLLGHWAKLRAYCARLALIVHFLRVVQEEASAEEVDGASLTRAVRLVDYFKGHARKVYARMQADPQLADAQRVFRWLIRNRLERFSKRDVHASHRSLFRVADQIDPVLAILERHYLIIRSDGERSGRGRPPSPEYGVNPLVYADTFAEDDAQNAHNSQNQANSV